ncbi:MAG: hypothetical protein F4Y79_22455 [Gemmatimonadetes bacterium]|nr:hypothetical protein [Gemmatimonadota bacterium]
MPQSQPRNKPVTQQDLEAMFTNAPKPEDFKLSPQEKQALDDLLAWEKRSAKMHWILGQPVGR